MASDSKTRQLDHGPPVDRISNLPRNLIDLILKRLPVHDTARTSVLSNTWRNVWGMHPYLVFDKIFFSQLLSEKDAQHQLVEAHKTINDILLLHNGPILQFHLSVPPNLPFNQCLDMDFWIKNISNNGVRKLEIYFTPLNPYQMPSYLFSCVELTKLKLSNCILNPPLRFGGFCNLLYVKLVNVIITADMSFGTRLEELYLFRCTGIEHLGCQFKYNNNLSTFVIIESGEVDWRWFECTLKVEDFGLMLGEAPNSTKKSINFDELVCNMPRINRLWLDSFFLKFSEPGAADFKRLITMENLSNLFLCGVGFNDLVQIQSTVCLIRRSPNLRYLFLIHERKVKSRDGMVSSSAGTELAVERYLHSPNFRDMILNQLETVEILGVVFSRAELQFIKILLASSPSLKRLNLQNDSTVDDPKGERRILRKLNRFPRASEDVQILWQTCGGTKS